MAFTHYSYYAYILQDSDATLERLKEALENFHEDSEPEEKPEIVLEDQSLILTFETGYRFYINFIEGELVNTEAQEMANTITEDWNEEPFDSEALKKCTKRFEMYGDDDEDMDYFNDSLFILQEIEVFSGIYIFNVN